MIEQVARAWRVLATGACFAAFGVGGLVLRLVVFPCIQLGQRNPQRRMRWSRAVIRVAFRAFVGMMRLFGVLSYETHGLERLKRAGLLIVANHPTLIDVVFLMALVRNADCVVKAGLWRNPFTHGPVRAAAYVSNDSGTGMLEECLASVRGGGNLIIFPEGTRTVPGQALAFQRGAANIAVRGGVNLTPVVVRCEPLTLFKGNKWYRVPIRRPHFVFSVGEDIPVTPYLGNGSESAKAVRHLTKYLELHFAQELAGNGCVVQGNQADDYRQPRSGRHHAGRH